MKRFGILTIFVFVGVLYIPQAHASSIPSLSLSALTSSVNIHVSNADPNAGVSFYFPNNSVSTISGASFTSIDIGQTDSTGSFNISVSPHSYGLSGGLSVYVSVNGMTSSRINWPTTSSNTGANSGTLTLSKQTVSLLTGQSANIFPMNTANTLTLQGNSNTSVVSASIQGTTNSLFVNALNAGTSNVTVCADTAGCASVTVTVQAPTQSVTFSQTQAYVTPSQTQRIGIYGGSSYYGLVNTNKDAVTATIDGTNLVLQGLLVGQSTVSVCADGLKCGSIIVNVVSSGTALPNQITVPQPVNLNANETPQLSSFSVSANGLQGLFSRTGNVININFGITQTVSNVQLRVDGTSVTANQNTNGLYYATYTTTGNETIPLPVIINFTNSAGLSGQLFAWIGNSSTLPVRAASLDTVSSSGQTFYRELKLNMKGSDVSALQTRLKKDGYYSGPITGTFGPLTQAGVKKYQSAHGLKQAGVVGPATQSLLNKEI